MKDEKRNLLATNPPFAYSTGIGGRTLTSDVDDPFWAVITDSTGSGEYGWQELWFAPDGTFTDPGIAGGDTLRYGTITATTAYEVNDNVDVPVGAIVRVYRGYPQVAGNGWDYRFFCPGISEVLPTTGVTDGSLLVFNGMSWTVQTLNPGTGISITALVGVITIGLSGGFGVPAPPDRSIQFNNGGSFGGSANNEWIVSGGLNTQAVYGLGNATHTTIGDSATTSALTSLGPTGRVAELVVTGAPGQGRSALAGRVVTGAVNADYALQSGTICDLDSSGYFDLRSKPPVVITETQLGDAGQPEIQTVDVPAASGGTYVLQGQTLAYNANTAAVQAALNTALGVGVVVVSGAYPNFTITWVANGANALLTSSGQLLDAATGSVQSVALCELSSNLAIHAITAYGTIEALASTNDNGCIFTNLGYSHYVTLAGPLGVVVSDVWDVETPVFVDGNQCLATDPTSTVLAYGCLVVGGNAGGTAVVTDTPSGDGLLPESDSLLTTRGGIGWPVPGAGTLLVGDGTRYIRRFYESTDASVSITPDPVGPALDFKSNANGAYTPANAGDWAGAPPTTIGEALDRLAAAGNSNTWPA